MERFEEMNLDKLEGESVVPEDEEISLPGESNETRTILVPRVVSMDNGQAVRQHIVFVGG